MTAAPAMADGDGRATPVRPSVRVRDDRPAMTPKKAKAAVVAKLTPAPAPTPKPAEPPKAAADEHAKLVSLHEMGILTDAEFQAALGRLLAGGRR